MNFAIFLAKNFAGEEFCTFPRQNLHLSFSPLEGRWVHTFRCQKRCALRSSSRSSFCFCQMAWQGIEALKQTNEFPAAPPFFSSKKWIKSIPKAIGNRIRDRAWGCAPPEKICRSKSTNQEKAFFPLTGLICAFRSADFLRWCLSPERNLTHNLFFYFQ